MICALSVKYMQLNIYKVTIFTTHNETLLYRRHYYMFLPAEKVAFQPLLLCRASVTNLINISPLEAVSVIRGTAFDVKPLLECRRNPLVVAPS